MFIKQGKKPNKKVREPSQVPTCFEIKTTSG